MSYLIFLLALFNFNSRYGLQLSQFDYQKVINNTSTLYLGARKIDEIGDYGSLNILFKTKDKLFD